MPQYQAVVSNLTAVAPGRDTNREPNLRLVAANRETRKLPSPVPLMQLSTGFWAFKTLAAAHELGLFDRLADGGSTTAVELTDALGIPPRPAEMLLTGCASLGLLGKVGRAISQRSRSRGLSGCRQAAIFRRLDRDGRQAAVCRLGQAHRGAAQQPADHLGPVHAILAVRRRGSEDAGAVLGRHAFAVDHDGARARASRSTSAATAVCSTSAAARVPSTSSCAANTANSPRPSSICRTWRAIAEKNVARAGLDARIGTTGGDFFGAFPAGYDLHLFSMILHDWDEAKNKALLRRSYDALAVGGAVVISVNCSSTTTRPDRRRRR